MAVYAAAAVWLKIILGALEFMLLTVMQLTTFLNDDNYIALIL